MKHGMLTSKNKQKQITKKQLQSCLHGIFLLFQLGVSGNNLDLVSSVCVLYLSARQPKFLQKVKLMS